jgi:hypothetical protein
MSEYRENAEIEMEEPAAKIEDGLRDVLAALKPFDGEEATRILLAVAALYDLPIMDLGIGGRIADLKADAEAAGVLVDDDVTE